MATANLIFRHTFDGAGYPTFATVWPDFDFPTAAGGINLAAYRRPVVDGVGHGFAARDIGGVTWRAVSQSSPATSDYRANLWSKWKNAGFAGRREVGLMVRVADVRNCLIARVRSMGTSSPELRLFKVIGGVETQLGSTYSGSDLSASQLNAGVAWCAVVEDLQDGTGYTRVRVYVGPDGGASRGTVRIDWTGDLPALRGVKTVGVELHDQVYLDDVRVDNLEVYDLADDWDPSGPGPSPGAGWQVELGTTLYSTEDLAALEPPVTLVEVFQGFGLKGNGAILRVDGDYRTSAVVFPGQRVRVLHDGAVRFAGRVVDGSQSATPGETQTWNCWDYAWESREIRVRNDDGTGIRHYNVSDPQSPEYDEDLQEKTIGQILVIEFDRNVARLRAKGAAPPTGLPYDAGELAAIDAVFPDLALSGTFPSALDTLLKLVAHRWQWIFDCATRVWHFVDVTSSSDEDLQCHAEWLQMRVSPDRDKSQSCVEWYGAQREEDTLELSVRGGGAKPIWTKEQEGAYGASKRAKNFMFGKVLGSGEGTSPNGNGTWYVDIAAGLLDEDDFRGGLFMLDGDGIPYLVVKNTSSRIWLSPPTPSVLPSVGTTFTINLLDPRALPQYSAMGVGRGYTLYPLTLICGSDRKIAQDFWQDGFCGDAIAVTMENAGAGAKAIGHQEEFVYRISVPTAFQQAAGFCAPTAVLSQPPKPSVGLVNYLPPAGGSPPSGSCVPGNSNAPAAMPQVDVQFKIPVTKPSPPYFREPELLEDGTETFYGPAYSDDPANWSGRGQPTGTDWGVTAPYIVDDPDFTSEEQIPGLRKAAQHVLAVKSQKAMLFEVRLATPWRKDTEFPTYPYGYPTSRFAGCTKRITISSVERATGFEALEGNHIFKVRWGVEANTTTIEAGTAAGWLDASGIDIAKSFSEARVLRKALTEVKRLEDFRNAMLDKSAARIGGEQSGPIDACGVNITNDQVGRVVSVEKDDADKIQNVTHQAVRANVLDMLTGAADGVFPGSPIAVPGRDGDAAMQATGRGALLGSQADPLIPFQGPAVGPNGNRGHYGGAIVTDTAAHGRAPDEVYRGGGFVVYKKADANGNRDGASGYEYKLLDAHGQPSGLAIPLYTALDLPTGGAPLSILAPGSTQRQILKMAETTAQDLGRVQNAITRALLAPGELTEDYPDGVPADIASIVRAGGSIPSGLRPVANTFPTSTTPGDPGGPVWEGPILPNGVSPGLFWRLKMPEGLLVRVTEVGAGDGMNGGRWELDTSGPGGSTEFASWMGIVHKQVHAAELTADQLQNPGAVEDAEIDNPFGFTNEGKRLNGDGSGSDCGVGAVIPVPNGVRGAPAFSAVVKEDTGSALEAAGGRYSWRIDHAYQASAWPASPTAGSSKIALIADGSNTATGQFVHIGGSVPAGLRAIAVSVIYEPSNSTVASATPAVVMGVGIDLVVIEGGYALIHQEAMEAAEEWGSNTDGHTDVLVMVDEWTHSAEVPVTDELDLVISWSLNLDPPTEVFDALAVGEEWQLIPSFVDDLEISEEWSFSFADVPDEMALAEEWSFALDP